MYLCRLGFSYTAPSFSQFILSCAYITCVAYSDEMDPGLVQFGNPLDKVIKDVFNHTISKETIPVENHSLPDNAKPSNYQHAIKNDSDTLKFLKYKYPNGEIVDYNYPVPIKGGGPWHVAGPVSPLNVIISLKEKAMADEVRISRFNVKRAFEGSTVYNNICKHHTIDAVKSNNTYYTEKLLKDTGLDGHLNGNRISFGAIEPENSGQGGSLYLNLAMKEREFRESNSPDVNEPAIVGRLRHMLCSDNFICSDYKNRASTMDRVEQILADNNPSLKAKKNLKFINVTQ
jgi:hypothetical protein